MKMIGDRFLFKICLCLFLLISINAQSQEDSKQWKVQLLFKPNVSIMNSSDVLGAKSRLNYGTSIHFMRENTAKKHFFSYGISIDRNSSKKNDLYDNRGVVDNDGNITEEGVRFYSLIFYYSYIASSIEYNYKIINNKNSSFGVSTGLSLKYYYQYKTQNHFFDETKTSRIKGKNIFENDILNNSSVNLRVWYVHNFAENWNVSLGADYSYDLNDDFAVPKYNKIGLAVGIIRTISTSL